MSFKPEIEKILNDSIGPKNCLCLFMKTDSQFEDENRDSSFLVCPGCSTRDTLIYAIIGYLTDRSSKELLAKIFQYISQMHPLKMVELLDTVYKLKDKANNFSEQEELEAGQWNTKWSYVFGEEIDKQDDKGN